VTTSAHAGQFDAPLTAPGRQVDQIKFLIKIVARDASPFNEGLCGHSMHPMLAVRETPRQ